MGAVWGAAILVIDPRGEFSVNDDWSFVLSLKALLNDGRIVATGWGPGGPALIGHLAWASPFVYFFGFTLTVMRVSVLVMGIIASVGLFFILWRSASHPWLNLFGGLTLIVNPLFMSQSFTFMTDITFTGWLSLSLVALHHGIKQESWPWIGLGLLLSLVGILTRQIGIVLPMAFIVGGLIHPDGRHLGRWRIFLFTIALALIPWMAWEYTLAQVGSTPVTRHEVFTNIVRYIETKGWAEYLFFIYTQLFHAALGYTAFLVSPLLVIQAGPYLRRPWIRKILLIYAGLWLVLLLVVWTKMLDLPVVFYRNVIVNFGIGPLLYKDVYILGHSPLTPLPAPLYYLMVGWTIPAVIMLITRLASSIYRLATHRPISLWAGFVCLAILAYLGIITLTGFHDRYIIPLTFMVIIWLVADRPRTNPLETRKVAIGISAGLLILLATFSIAGTHDFMATKRATRLALDNLLIETKVDPCHVDGGFEFNGYHCYTRGKKSSPGKSWWWVEQEDYVVTLGPLPGYETIKTYPFRRYLDHNGFVYVLKPGY